MSSNITRICSKKILFFLSMLPSCLSKHEISSPITRSKRGGGGGSGNGDGGGGNGDGGGDKHCITSVQPGIKKQNAGQMVTDTPAQANDKNKSKQSHKNCKIWKIQMK
jgi:hypothetical protein